MTTDQPSGEPPMEKLLKRPLESIRDIELYDDDVIICAFPKCGTHWVWEVVEMLRSGVIEYRKQVKETQEFELIYKEGVDALPAPRTLNTHLYLRMLPKQVVEKKIKCIQIMRNPKDACVSFFNQYRDTLAPVGFEGDLGEFTEIYLSGQMFFGSYSDYLLTWKAELDRSPGQPVLELVYEDMKLDPVKSVKDIARFLGLAVTDQFCEEVAHACSFKKMRQVDKDLKEEYDMIKFWERGDGWLLQKRGSRRLEKLVHCG
ncbi:sulfotransferase 1A1-like [Haliotis rubra]|uniref:sulfotransferase 1A1-like n=1 Tax=Haliotis rubra TaxID=36100 RepID=UPI001EE616A4|nr:sulfotransferase 1A1-like [Haliotis rubra]